MFETNIYVSRQPNPDFESTAVLAGFIFTLRTSITRQDRLFAISSIDRAVFGAMRIIELHRGPALALSRDGITTRIIRTQIDCGGLNPSAHPAARLPKLSGQVIAQSF